MFFRLPATHLRTSKYHKQLKTAQTGDTNIIIIIIIIIITIIIVFTYMAQLYNIIIKIIVFSCKAQYNA